MRKGIAVRQAVTTARWSAAARKRTAEASSAAQTAGGAAAAEPRPPPPCPCAHASSAPARPGKCLAPGYPARTTDSRVGGAPRRP